MRVSFPKQWRVSDTELIEAANKIARKRKAVGWDTIDRNFFSLFRDCYKEEPCWLCQRKIKLMRGWTEESYWTDGRSSIHLKARMITLNKEFPKIPEYTRYRPIIITSYVVKFLEMLITKSIRNFESRLPKSLFGFIKNSSIA